jgi:hypothetical protein
MVTWVVIELSGSAVTPGYVSSPGSIETLSSRSAAGAGSVSVAVTLGVVGKTTEVVSSATVGLPGIAAFAPGARTDTTMSAPSPRISRRHKPGDRRHDALVPI